MGATWVHKLVSKQESTNLIFFLYDCNQIHYQIGYMGQFVHIICCLSYWYHTVASWPFVSKVGVYWCNLHKLVRKKSSNLSVYFYHCNQIHHQMNYMGPFIHIICIHHSGITQRPHDHLFQKAGWCNMHKVVMKKIDMCECLSLWL